MAATIEEMSSATTGTKTVASLARDWALTMPGKVAMREKDFGIWQEYNWAQTWDLIETAAHGLLVATRMDVLGGFVERRCAPHRRVVPPSPFGES